ncbi:hypothetical protein WJX81_008632 [Elliptochloris bilobata]|uniref:Protein kinase domain-containing protein n=1 Tax=Elliptochloris bilobata TaxID=381761 RepID=A0AAW1S9U3_9CHLO
MQAPGRSPAGARQPDGQPTSRWKVELPTGTAGDDQFGGCRTVEHSYVKNKQIGEGTYGQVYLANDKETNEEVALKKIRMDNEKEGFPITAIREIKLLKNLEHENVIRLKEIVRSQSHKCNNMKGSIYMVFDYMDHDMTGLMERKAYKFKPEQVKCYMRQLLAGLAYCHSNNVLHRDLKASNLLVNNKGILKLADFGLARKYAPVVHNERYTNRVITLWYRPPELILGSEHYGPEIDMWSVGCIFAELLCGKPLFPGKDEADQIDKIGRVLGSPCEENMPGCSSLPWTHMMKQIYKQNRLRQTMDQSKMTPGAMDLLSKMLTLDPKRRISAIDAFGDDYFWKLPPSACDPSALPTYDASHELDMKKRRHAEREQRHAQSAGQAHHGGAPDAKRARYSSSGAPGPAPHHAHSGYGGAYGAVAGPVGTAAGGYMGAAAAVPYGTGLAYPSYGADAGYYAGQAAAHPQTQSGYGLPPAGARPPLPRPAYGASGPPGAMANWQKQRR